MYKRGEFSELQLFAYAMILDHSHSRVFVPFESVSIDVFFVSGTFLAFPVISWVKNRLFRIPYIIDSNMISIYTF
jgi:hypothetical protein